MTDRLRTIALGGALVALVVLVATGWLVARAIDGVHRAEVGRHGAVVDDLFDELEGELSALVSREERRSFLEYRHVYVPEGVPVQGSAGLVRSPLAELPDDPAIVGYFQLDPGGDCNSPSVPRGNELEVAVASGWSPTADGDARQQRMRDVLAQVGSWGDAVPPPPPEPIAVQQVEEEQAPQPPKPSPRPQQQQQQLSQYDANTVQLKRGTSARSGRTSQVVSTGALNLDTFNPSEQDVLDNLALANARAPTRLQSDVDVRLSPIGGLRVGEYLVLHRTVRIEGAQHRQGLVVHVGRLAEGLQSEVLGGSNLEPWLDLAWDGGSGSEAVHTFEHRFAEPFESLAVTASVATIPELASREGWVLGGLAGLVLAVVLVGGAGLWRTVRAEVELAQRRSDFAAAVTHELKTPLTTIRMYGEMLRDGLVPDPERQHEYHATLVTESERLTRLVGNVLELARIERGTAGVQPQQVDLTDLSSEVQELVAPLVAAAGAVLEVDVVASESPEVVVERDALVQALCNLVDNALKFSAGAVDRRVHLTARLEGGILTLAVRDHGPGVPRGQLQQIFEPFHRGERELTRRTTGTGIGLALVHGFVRRVGGSVQATNVPDGGLQVLLTLPARPG